MREFVLSNELEEENKWLVENSKYNIARMSAEKWNINENVTVEQLRRYVNEENHMDVAYVDVTRKHAIEATEELRREHKNAVLLVIADEHISPMEYMKPTVGAASLLLRPFDEKLARAQLEETWKLYSRQREDGERYFITNVKYEKVSIPLGEILFIESQNKRVDIHLEEKIYTVDETLEHIKQQTPNYFLQCHRSFLVNKQKIVDVLISPGEILLEKGQIVPLSRSYKSKWKEIKKEFAI